MVDPMQSTVWPPAPTFQQPQSYDPVRESLAFKREGSILVLGASILTLGLYPYYWMYRKALELGSAWPNNGLNPETYLVLLGLDTISIIGTRCNASPDIFWGLFAISMLMIRVTFTFKLRNRINILLGGDSTKKYWIGGLGTFFAGVLFINYQLNRARQAAELG